MLPAAFPPARPIATNGIELAVHEQGEGPAVFLLHGFPELPYSWRHQVGPIAEAGFRVLVPAQRGYDGSDAPADPRSYSVRNLVADLVGVLDALELERAVFVGHDWGGVPAWHAGVYASDRVDGMASLCTPFAAPGKTDLVTALRTLRGPNHYIIAFQAPGVGEALLERDVEATFRALIRRRGSTLPEFRAAPPEIQEVPVGLFVGDPQLFGDELLADEELAVYVEAYERTGFTGGLNWYRALRTNWEEGRGRDHVVDKPALMISAADDWFLPPETTAGMEALLPQLERHVIPDAGHWLQQERPEQVNALLVAWLRRIAQAP
jgi:soluble epoxide hydrolase / lipid-phosphate phosphatase